MINKNIHRKTSLETVRVCTEHNNTVVTDISTTKANNHNNIQNYY